jgi:hypothetical protein
MRALPFLLASLPFLGCASSPLHIAGAPPASAYVVGPRGEPVAAEPGRVRFTPGLCSEDERRTEEGLLDVDTFLAFLRAQGVEARVMGLRGDLSMVEARAGTEAPVRFRVAVLPSPGAAGQELHKALLEHGLGAWGVRRANLAILVASPAPFEDVIVFASRTKLACWGALAVAGLDDVYVVPGGYFEL